MEHTKAKGGEISDYDRIIIAMEKMSPTMRRGTAELFDSMAKKGRRNGIVAGAIGLMVCAVIAASASHVSPEVFWLIVAATVAMFLVLILWAGKIL